MRRGLEFPIEATLLEGTPVEVTFETMAVPPPYELTRTVFGWVFNGDELLLTCDRTGTWGLPSGNRRPGETLREAFERSLWEATGAKLAGVRMLGALRTERRGVAATVAPLPISYRVCFVADVEELAPFSPAFAGGDRLLIEPGLASRLIKRWSPLMDEMLRYAQATRSAGRTISRQLA